jgi:BirA family transcriptional regulator, biotin operon repressor / biotin---[acetyl-CoA-carboxylase] ligase
LNAPPDPQHADPVIHTGLLHALLDSDQHLSAHTLMSAMRRNDPTALRCELDRLRDAGCELDINPQQGVRLVRAGLGCWADYLQTQGDKLRIVEVYRQTGSTQDTARHLIAQRGAAADGALVIAEEQTAGRGRLGRRWIAPAGTALTFSRVCRTAAPDDEQAVNRLTFATSVAIAQTLEHWLTPRGQRARIKWPNDILVDGRKIAGILVEVMHHGGAGHFAIIGIGLNISLLPEHLPDDPQDPALRNRITSLAMLDIHADRLAVLGRLVEEVDHALDRADPDDLIARWRSRSTLIGQHVSLQSDGIIYDGEVADLDPNLGLILRTTNGAMVHLPAATTTVIL